MRYQKIWLQTYTMKQRVKEKKIKLNNILEGMELKFKYCPNSRGNGIEIQILF